MTVTELRSQIVDNFDYDEFKEIINEGKYAKRWETFIKMFPTYKDLGGERTCGSGDYDGFVWRFQIDDKCYQIDGWYSSYEGSNMDDPFKFYEVKEVERTIKVWVKA